MVGTGVTLQSVQSVRDNILDLRIDQETSQQSSLNSYVDSMNQVQSLFNETQGTGLQTYLSNFFNSFQSLATDPTSSSLRQSVIIAGQDLAGAFSQTSRIWRPSNRGWTNPWCRPFSKLTNSPRKWPT